MKVRKRVALITGSTRGIGLAIGELLVDKGYIVILNSRAAFGSLNEQLQLKIKGNVDLDYYQADNADESEAKRMIMEICAKYGSIDVLVNNIGKTIKSPLAFMKADSIMNLFAVNVGSAIYCSKYCLKRMVINGSGRIINISSMAGVHGLQQESVYSAMKSALIGFTKAIAKEYGAKGILCNAVAPGIIKTEFENLSLQDQEIVQTVPVKRFGKAQDVALAVAFLAAEEMSYITGQIIEVNGGLYL